MKRDCGRALSTLGKIVPLVLLALAAASLGVASAASNRAEAQGEAPAIDSGLEAAGWRLYRDSRWTPARFRLLGDGAIEISSDNSTALIWRKIAEGDAGKAKLAWEWRVDEIMPPTDITVKGGDDRPLALHVWFMKPRDQLGFLEGLKADLTEAVTGLPIHGRLLTYVWGGQGRRGDAQPNPHVGESSWMIVLRSGREDLGTWLPEMRDLEADYRAAFGEAPPARGIIALAADSEDTRTRSRARLRRLRFAP